MVIQRRPLQIGSGVYGDFEAFVKIDGHFHMLRDTAAVGWLLKGIPIETVSILLGHSSVRVTEKHYSPWIKRRQDRLELMRSWA